VPTRTRAGFSSSCFSFVVSLCLFPCVLSANSAPSDINASNLTLAENSAIGTVIGEFNATDPDGDNNITFRLLPDAPKGMSPLVWLDSTDLLTLNSDYNRTSPVASGLVAGWQDKSGRGQHFGQGASSARPSTGIRTYNGLNVLDFNGTNWIGSNEILSTGSDFSILMFAKIDSVSSEWDSLISSSGTTPNFQFDAGVTSSFLGRFHQNGMGTSKIFSSVSLREPAIWQFSFNYSSTRRLNISVNGKGLGDGFTSYTTPPHQSSNKFFIFGNRATDCFPKGFLGEFLIFSNDYPSSSGVYSYLSAKWLGEPREHDAFQLDSNGSLQSNHLLDFETDDASQTIRVVASDGVSQSIPAEFTVNLTNVFEDLDGDGVEDFYDLDRDGDGLSNLLELWGRSDPMNSVSSNATPSDINATTSLSFSESLSLGAIAVDFNATDTDSEDNLTYRVQQNVVISDVPGISAWFDASDLDSLTTDLSGNTVFSWSNQVDAQVKLSNPRNGPSTGAYINGVHALFFDKNESLTSQKNDEPWSPWSADGSIAGSFTDGSFFLVLRTFEVQRTSLPVLGNGWSGHLPWIGGGFFWDIWKNGEPNRIAISPFTEGNESMVVTFFHSKTDARREFFKNGKSLITGSPFEIAVESPITCPSTNFEPQFLYGEMLFVR